MACSSSALRRLSALISAAASRVTPSRCPSSTYCLRTRLRSFSAFIPSHFDTAVIAAHSLGLSSRCSNTNLTAFARVSGAYLLGKGGASQTRDGSHPRRIHTWHVTSNGSVCPQLVQPWTLTRGTDPRSTKWVSPTCASAFLVVKPSSVVITTPSSPSIARRVRPETPSNPRSWVGTKLGAIHRGYGYHMREATVIRRND